MSEDLQRLIDIAETWDVQRKLDRTWSNDDMVKFAQVMNDRTRQLIRCIGREHVDIYSALAELCVNAQTLLDAKAKLIIEGKNRKDL